MDSQKIITSLQNPLVKKVLQLQEKSRERKKTGLFIIEGLREIQLAQKGGYSIETLLHCEDINSNLQIEVLDQIVISRTVYEKLAYRQTTEGVLAIAKSKNHSLDSLNFKTKNPLILVAEAPEKPGNIGALLRTADAANLDAVLIANPKSDLYNPNVIRSSVGCLFTTKVGMGTTEEIISFLQQQGITINCAALTASKNYIETDFTKPTAIVVGTEATGLSDTWLANSDQNIIIPMQGEIDSMNVSVSAAILIFEAKRQRGF
ncbi:RNA methyltransferase [Croceitalea sp. MTPC9]|uniref:TrmH family RNA methyltransferase n=1 Tax=unclassified Croceitalea TaxID=2632280 RepID=UPI002B3679AD|nr:RNA methyltransferase [Croceitalea sp. MTPC6]GMN15240.1 RNA methyltransferase [Croceitalea sp. MTPC9]